LIPVVAAEYLSASQLAEIQGDLPAGMHQGYFAEKRLRIMKDLDDRLRVYLQRDVYHRAIVEALNDEGFRLPTSDEWEYACAAGTRTLFRWGDECPVIFLPCLEDEAGAFFERYFPGPHGQTDLYHKPNAYGLMMPDDPYDWELCTDPTVMRGGDGGGAICGGEGLIKSWLPLASAYEHKRHQASDEQIFGAWLRRVCSLD
jgi:hypothetical protein